MSRYRQPYTLYKREKYWYYRTYTPDGLRTAGKTTGCTSKSMAKQYCDRLYKEGELWTSDQTFESYALHFFDEDGLYFTDRQKKASPKTIIQYQSNMKNHIMPYFHKMKLGDINYTTLKKYRLYLQDEKKLSDKSILLIMTNLKIIISYAFRDRIIYSNPFDFIKTPKIINQKKRDAFTLDEVKILYTKIDERFKNQILLMALTGMRIKESICQTIDDVIDADGYSYINLQWQYYEKDKKLPVKRNSYREIPIIQELKELLYFDEQLDTFYEQFKPIKEQFNNYKERNLSFHSLRHFFITNSKSSGIMPIKIEYLAGHSLKGIEGVYTNFKSKDVLEIMTWQKELYDYITK